MQLASYSYNISHAIIPNAESPPDALYLHCRGRRPVPIIIISNYGLWDKKKRDSSRFQLSETVSYSSLSVSADGNSVRVVFFT